MKINIEIKIWPAYLKYRYIHIPAKFKDSFPNIKTTQELDLETNIGKIKTTFYSIKRKGPGIRSKGLTRWFERNPGLKEGQKIIIEIVESNMGKKYSLKI